MAVTPGACGQRMYPLQMRSLGYRAIQTQLMECAFDINDPIFRVQRALSGETGALWATVSCWRWSLRGRAVTAL